MFAMVQTYSIMLAKINSQRTFRRPRALLRSIRFQRTKSNSFVKNETILFDVSVNKEMLNLNSGVNMTAIENATHAQSKLSLDCIKARETITLFGALPRRSLINIEELPLEIIAEHVWRITKSNVSAHLL